MYASLLYPPQSAMCCTRPPCLSPLIYSIPIKNWDLLHTGHKYFKINLVMQYWYIYYGQQVLQCIGTIFHTTLTFALLPLQHFVIEKLSRQTALSNIGRLRTIFTIFKSDATRCYSKSVTAAAIVAETTTFHMHGNSFFV
jgi:hypothetical protein